MSAACNKIVGNFSTAYFHYISSFYGHNPLYNKIYTHTMAKVIVCNFIPILFAQ